jgi:putative endonuclease
MSRERQALGLLGERLAYRWLRAQGWTLVAHRFRTGHRDIDLIVRRDTLVAFVEVKARRGEQYGPAVAAVGWRKRRELSISAAVWVDRHGHAGLSYRFDVIGVQMIGQKARIEYIPNAFCVEKSVP